MFCFNSNATFVFFSVFCLSALPGEAIKLPCLIETHSQSLQDINSNDYNADAAGNLNQLFPKHLNLLLPLKQTESYDNTATFTHLEMWILAYPLLSTFSCITPLLHFSRGIRYIMLSKVIKQEHCRCLMLSLTHTCL